MVTALAMIAAVGILGSRRPELPGSLGVVCAELRVGMSQEEAVARIRAAYLSRERGWDNPRLYADGRTHDGRKFGHYFDWDFTDFPPADQVAWAEVDFDDDDSRDLIVTFGPGGVVSGIHFRSDSIWEEWRFALAR
ncbi:hypothetical protein [Frigoriglobus tundricola]|uniref:hypothetical protein n=1 Tax=Frigoriglobus tundricola TaxID=2774151 RepID=UPI00148EBE49|nr:hypothetical protein [Frigoriglobus tundricola]